MSTDRIPSDAEAQGDHFRMIGTEYGDQSSPYWTFYGSESETYDQKFVQALKDDMTLILIVNVLFSSIVATFVVSALQTLQPNNSQETVCQLSLISQGNTSRQSSPFCLGTYPGVPSTAAIRSNILLFLSFFLVMMTVLACVLIQQWCREFMQYAYLSEAPHKRGRVRTYLFRGLRGLHIRGLIYVIHVIMQASVFIFFCGVSDYLHIVYPRVGMTSWYCTIALAVMYMAFSASPLVTSNSPCKTALTAPIMISAGLLRFLVRIVRWYLRPSSEKQEPFPPLEDFYLSKKSFLVKVANENAENLDPYAMKQLFIHHDLRDADMDKFLEGLPGYIHSHFTVAKSLSKALTEHNILSRIKEHLLTCVTVTELSDEVRIKRASACVKSLGAILQHPTMTSAEELGEVSLQECVLGIVNDLNTLCEEPGKKVKLRAFCVRAVAVQGFLTKCLEPAKKRSPNQFPGPFHALYTLFSSGCKTSPIPQQVTVALPVGDSEMWKTVLHDGPLDNLTFLTRKILSLAKNIFLEGDVDPPDLSLCWETFDKLRSELRIDRVDVSGPSLARFNHEHKEARILIENEGPDFSAAPLLEVLDAVAGGRHLSMVFQGDSKYHSKANLVFGKDRLRSPDLLRAFANRFPDFAISNSEKSVEVMKNLICHDHLWTSLEVSLLNSLRSNAFIPAKLRVFERCCTVIDAAFVALEKSPNVDWRASELGSLARYFEIFVTDCFQGMFTERAVVFRVGLIKARFCKAVLTKFLDEFNREGTVVFRSHADVASLARVFYSLGVGEDEDVKFWKSFVDGGPIGAEFMEKTHATLNIAARDGPLLNFCKLGYLGLVAVPFKGSGLEDTDFSKLLNLLQTTTEGPRLTLASTPVWEDLGRLRKEVFDICAGSSNKDEENMQELLVKIDAVHEHCPSSTQEHHPSDHVPSQASETSAVVQPNPPSTTIGGSQVQPVDLGGIITPTLFNNSRRNLYINPYPFLPRLRGAMAPPLLAFPPTPSPPLGSTDLAYPGNPAVQHLLNYTPQNEQDRGSLYYFPSGTPTSAVP